MFKEYVTFGDAIIISVFCISVVFVTLYLISFIVDITRIFALKKKKKDLGLDASSIAIIGSADGPTSVIVSDTVKEAEDDTELVAVITAAIAAMTGTDASGLVVKNIKKLPDSDTAWSRIGRIELMR